MTVLVRWNNHGVHIKNPFPKGIIPPKTKNGKLETCMKTVEEIIEYLQTELACAKIMHDAARGNERLYFLLKVKFITELLEEIKE